MGALLTLLLRWGLDLRAVLEVLRAIEAFLNGEEVTVYVTIRSVRLKVSVDLRPPMLKIERVEH